MTIAQHFTARTRRGWTHVVDPESSQWLWGRLRERFPRVFACALMPDHLHLSPVGLSDPDALRRVLQHHSRAFGAHWDLADPQPVTTPRILGRTVRYHALNAPRAALVEHPFEWPWSTLRDMVGAVDDPWVSAREVGRACRMRPAELLEWIVGSDVGASASSGLPMAASLHAIAEAAAAATRATPSEIRRPGPTRRAFVGLARDIGGCRVDDLAHACGITTRAVHKIQRGACPVAVAAARRCLADPRLRRWRAVGSDPVP